MTEGRVAEPVDASTVILVRHGQPIGSPWQCFMVRRHARSDFASDVYVFPGGKVDADDTAPELLDRVDSEPHPLERSVGRDRWLGLQVAALREMFEEAGVLLARDAEGQLIRFDGERAKRIAACRRRLQEGATSMLELVRGEDLRLAADRLHPFAHWITPAMFPRRYDTRFWVAYLPDGQAPVHDAKETTAGTWISPRAALERFRVGDFPLVFATERNLERMARFPSIEQMIAETAEADLQPVMPKPVQIGNETQFILPGEAGYD